MLQVKVKTNASIFNKSALLFDEMQLEEACEFSARLRRLFIQHKKGQVVPLQGLFHSWKQVVYYDFDREHGLGTFEFFDF